MRRLGHWLAILAFTLQAVWPLVVAAKPAAVTLVPVCTIDGITHYLEVPIGKSPLEHSVAHHKHCAFCTLGGVGFLPTQPQLFIADAAAETIATAVEQTPALAVVQIHGARAPPFFSVVIAHHDNFGEERETNLFGGRAARAPYS